MAIRPTQLYEAAWLADAACPLIRRRRGNIGYAGIIGRYLVFAAGFRFPLEFIRVNPGVALGMRAAQ